MPDVISSSDKELIAAALAAGRVTVCPPHTFTIDESQPATFAQVKASMWMASARKNASRGAGEAQRIKGVQTRSQIRKLALTGMNAIAIAEKTFLGESTVYAHLKALRKSGHLPADAS